MWHGFQLQGEEALTVQIVVNLEILRRVILNHRPDAVIDAYQSIYSISPT